MKSLTHHIDVFRDYLLKPELDKANEKNPMTNEDLIYVLEESIIRARKIRTFNPSKILSRAVMLPSYQRLIDDLKNIPDN